MIRSQFSCLLPRNAFLRGVTLLAGGTAGAQLLVILASPLITRLYTPRDFGIVAIYAGLLAIFGAIATLHYHLAIPLPEDDHEAAHLVAISLGLVLIAVFISTAVVALFRDPIAAAFDVPLLRPYLWLLPVGVLVSGIYQVFSSWSIRTKQFSTLAETHIRQGFASVVIQLTGFKLGFFALLLAQLTSQGLSGLQLASHFLKKKEFRQLKWQRLKEVAIRYRRFPAYSSWAGLLGVAGAQAAPLIFAALFGAAAVGLYALAHRLLTIPLTLIGGAVGNVFLANGAELHREGRLGELVATVHDRFAQIGMPLFVIILIFGPEIFATVFGDSWRQSGEIARWMVPWLYLQLCSSSLPVLVITGHQHLNFIMQATLLLLRLLSICLGYWANSFLLAIIFFSAFSAIAYFIFLVIKMKISRVALSIAMLSLFRGLALAFICFIPIGIGYYNSNHFELIAVLSTALLLTLRYSSIYLLKL